MTTYKKRTTVTATGALTAASLVALVACGGTTNGETPATDEGLPEQMVWSVYSVGAGTYNDMAAVSEAFLNEYGTQIRMVPSGTGVGRLAALRDGEAEIGRLGEEYWYAFEGDLEYADTDWGPQDLRALWLPDGPIGLGVSASSDIENVEDLQGARVPNVTANPSVNNKLDAYLAFADLTRDDVDLVDMNYDEQGEALQNNQIDAVIYNPYASQMYEFDADTSIQWLDISGGDSAATGRVDEVAPTATIEAFGDAAGMEEGDEVSGIHYSTAIVAYADDVDTDYVESILEAFQETLPAYEDATPTSGTMAIDSAPLRPQVVPFHEGTVSFLEDQGHWDEEAEAINNELIERGEVIRSLWEDYLAEHDEEPSHETWNEWKDEHAG